MSGLLAAGLAALSAALAVGAPAHRLRHQGLGPRPRPHPGAIASAALTAGIAVAAAASVVLVDGLHLVLALLLVGCAAAVLVLARRARAARVAERRRARVVEVCEALAGELRAGQPVVAAVEHGAQVWPELYFDGLSAASEDSPTAPRRPEAPAA